MSRVVDLTSVPSGLRVVALWSTTTPENENAQDRAKRGRLGRPVASLFDGTFYHR